MPQRFRDANRAVTALSASRLTARYAIALLIVALLTVASHVVLGSVLRTDAGAASTINLTGRQRMLS